MVLIALLLVVQVGLVVQDQILVTHAAREGARAAAVDSDPSAPREAVLRSARFDAQRLAVARGPRGGTGSIVQVTVRYRSPTLIPLAGRLVADVEVEATAAMRVE